MPCQIVHYSLRFKNAKCSSSADAVAENRVSNVVPTGVRDNINCHPGL